MLEGVEEAVCVPQVGEAAGERGATTLDQAPAEGGVSVQEQRLLPEPELPERSLTDTTVPETSRAPEERSRGGHEGSHSDVDRNPPELVVGLCEDLHNGLQVSGLNDPLTSEGGARQVLHNPDEDPVAQYVLERLDSEREGGSMQKETGESRRTE